MIVTFAHSVPPAPFGKGNAGQKLRGTKAGHKRPLAETVFCRGGPYVASRIGVTPVHICLLHGYLLEGSGSNLWTRSVLQALAWSGHTVHLVCQDAHPDQYDFIAELRIYPEHGPPRTTWSRAVPSAGRVIMHKPVLGDLLPVYVWDKYEEFPRVVPMVDLPNEEIEQYIARNVCVVEQVVREHDIDVLHANHAVLMSVVAERVSATTGVPYIVMPHGSALEYAVKPDPRFHAYASSALQHASRVLVSAEELGDRVRSIFPDLNGLSDKMGEVRVGVDTLGFTPITRAERPANIAKLHELLAPMQRGRSQEQTEQLSAAVKNGGNLDQAIALAAMYDGKAPDQAAEAKLDSVDWLNDDVLIFVGRIIVAKGVHCIVAALPEILDQRPNTKLLIAGHGPLRETLELLLYALRTGDRALAERLAAGDPDEDRLVSERLDGVPEYWQRLRTEGRLDAYYAAAARRLTPDTVQFLGYLTHRELRWLFPCCDVGIFPSMVKESGPMVFLEALSSGCFPIGTYFAGTKDKIDTVGSYLEPGDTEWMKVRPDPLHLTADLARNVPNAIAVSERYAKTFRKVAEQEYDWAPIAAKLYRILQEVAAERAR
jgi:glycosyltransferase involved in cell wall biosynthesis